MAQDPIRSKIMASIKSKNTKPEVLIRRGLHSRGIRYRLHSNCLPGHPDVVSKKYNAIILINGCFWHKHDCHLFNPQRKLPPTWENKIEANVKRDNRNIDIYLDLGWRILIVWECAVVGKERWPYEMLIDRIENWLQSDQKGRMEIRGMKG